MLNTEAKELIPEIQKSANTEIFAPQTHSLQFQMNSKRWSNFLAKFKHCMLRFVLYSLQTY